MPDQFAFGLKEDYDKYEKLKEILKDNKEHTLSSLRKKTGLAYNSIIKATRIWGFKVLKKKMMVKRLTFVVIPKNKEES